MVVLSYRLYITFNLFMICPNWDAISWHLKRETWSKTWKWVKITIIFLFSEEIIWALLLNMLWSSNFAAQRWEIYPETLKIKAAWMLRVSRGFWSQCQVNNYFKAFLQNRQGMQGYLWLRKPELMLGEINLFSDRNKSNQLTFIILFDK